MDDIVRTSGVSKGGIYWHFKSKEEIFLYLLEKNLELNQKGYESLLKKNETGAGQLHEYLSWHMQGAMENFSFHALVAEFIVRTKSQNIIDKLKSIAAKKFTDTDIIGEILNDGVSKGEFVPTIDTQAMAEVFSALCGGICQSYMFHKNSELLKRSFAVAEDIFIKSILRKRMDL